MSFASLANRANAVTAARLANASASYLGGEQFGVLFDRAAADPFDSGAVDATAHRCAFDLAYAPGLAEGGELVVDGVVYVVSSGVQSDASGWVTLSVYPKA